MSKVKINRSIEIGLQAHKDMREDGEGVVVGGEFDGLVKNEIEDMSDDFQYHCGYTEGESFVAANNVIEEEIFPTIF